MKCTYPSAPLSRTLRNALVARMMTEDQIMMTGEDLRTMRHAFTGLEPSPKGMSELRIRLEDGKAYLCDGLRMHAIPIAYPFTESLEIPFEEAQQAWMEEGDHHLAVEPVDGFIRWNEMIPQVDLGTLCHVGQFNDALEAVRHFDWAQLSFETDRLVLTPHASNQEGDPITLEYEVYKGKDIVRSAVVRVVRPHFLFDVFQAAQRLGDSRLFLCLVSGDVGAPLLCRGNRSSFLSLLLSRK